MRRLPLLAAAVPLVMAASVAAQGASAPRTVTVRQPVPLTVETYRLGNGMNVILARDNSVPVVTVNVWYHVGSANERAGRSGFAHLFEHMMFQGSQNVGDDQHFQIGRAHV